MGAWSHQPFGNDTACDWISALRKRNDLSPIEKAFDVVLQHEGYLESDEAMEAIGAVEALAKLLGRGTQVDAYTADLDEWVARNQLKPEAALMAKAQAAIDRVLGADSELNELWCESDDGEPWKSSVLHLRSLVHV